MVKKSLVMGMHKTSPRTTVVGSLIKRVDGFTNLLMSSVEGSIGFDKIFPKSGGIDRRGFLIPR